MEEQKKKKRPKILKLVIILLCFLVGVYIIIQFIIISRPSFKTQTAIRYELADTLMCDSILAMPQSEVYYDSGVPDYLVENGAKVVAGGALAQIFATAQDAQNNVLAQNILAEIQLLKNAQKSTLGINIETLLTQTQSNIYSLIELADTRKYLGLSNKKQAIQNSINRTQIATKEQTDFEARISELSLKRDELINGMQAVPVIYSPANGFFVSSKNGAKQAYTSEQLADMTPLELSNAVTEPGLEYGSNVVGRLIYDYKWDLYLSVDIKSSKKFIEGNTVMITFTQVTSKQIPAKVTKVLADDANNTAKIILSGDYLNGDIASIQSAKATITFPAGKAWLYEGIRIPKSALRVIDGETGVYIRYGNLTQYRKISILFENENYILAPFTYEKGKNEIKLFDEVITEGRGLANQVNSQK